MKRLLLLYISVFFVCAALGAFPQHARAVSNVGLAGYWSFNEGNGAVATDFSGNGNSGMLSFGPVWMNGKLGKALSFDGVNDRVVLSASSNFIPSANAPTTIAFWFNAAVIPSTGNMTDSGAGRMVNFHRGDSAGTALTIGVYSSDNIAFYNHGDTSTTNWDQTIAPNQWYHIALVYDGTCFQRYINGAADGTCTTKTLLGGGSFPFIMGAYDDSGNSDSVYGGRLDEVRIYNRALSTAEVAELYRAGLALYRPPNNLGLVGYWDFNEGTGATANDSSGLGNAGTFGGNTAWTSGKRGSAVIFDGDNDYVEIGNQALVDGSTQMSVCSWMRYTPASVAADGVIAGEFSNSGGSWVLIVDDSAQLTGRTDTVAFIVDPSQGQNGRIEGSTGLVVSGQWDHYCGTFQGGNFIRLYKNGVLDQEFASGSVVASVPVSALAIRFGATSDTQRDLSASIDEVRIYNRALSAAEVAALYASSAARLGASSVDLQRGSTLGSGLVGHWTFDGSDLTAATATDRSGNGNDGTLANGPVPVIGKLGQALQFNGSNSRVALAGNIPGLNLGAAHSICAWVKDYDITYNNVGFPTVVALTDGTRNTRFGITNNNGTAADGGVFVGGSLNQTQTTATQLTDNVWAHICYTTQDGSAVTIYVDGASKTTTSNGLSGSNVNLIGACNTVGNTCPFRGSIDDVRVYARALTADEVRQLYNLGSVRIMQ